MGASRSGAKYAMGFNVDIPVSLEEPDMGITARTLRTAALALTGICFLPAIVSAQSRTVFILGGSALRAGPSMDEAEVGFLADGRAANVFGCLDSGDWCDVGKDYDRGWVSTTSLTAIAHGQRVRVDEAFNDLHLPIETVAPENVRILAAEQRAILIERELRERRERERKALEEQNARSARQP
jgi:uncharacterized protein YraI